MNWKQRRYRIAALIREILKIPKNRVYLSVDVKSQPHRFTIAIDSYLGERKAPTFCGLSQLSGISSPIFTKYVSLLSGLLSRFK